MGRATIIILLGFSIITSFIILKLNANSKEGLTTTVDHYENTSARLIANSGVEIYLEKLRRDKDLVGNFSNINLDGGEYSISISGPDTFRTITSIATLGGTTHTSIVEARRFPVKLPKINAAVYIEADTLALNLNGNMNIDGNDYLMNGTPGPESPLPGIGVDDAPDSSFIIDNVKPKIAGEIDGYGGTPSVWTINDNIDWLALAKELIFSADTTLVTGTYTQASFGTPAEPIITFVNGNVDFTDATGYGVMVINGNANMSGNFKYYGIVIVYDQSTIRCQTIGNNGIYGATILVGKEVSIESQGNSTFYYSSEAINLAKLKLKSSRFEIVSWWE